jgi:site-specific DNA-cytosine methylase
MQRQNEGHLPPFPIWDDVRSFDGRDWRGAVDVVSGGFPCQDISSAGTGDGLDGERSGLWGEFARIICEVRPRFAFVENSPVLTSRGLDRVLGDLAELGFDAEWGVLGAHHAGLDHRRFRIWIVAHATGNGLQGGAKAPRPDNGKLRNDQWRDYVKMKYGLTYPHPTHSEIRLGWPAGWSDFAPLETDKFQAWRRLHGGF